MPKEETIFHVSVYSVCSTLVEGPGNFDIRARLSFAWNVVRNLVPRVVVSGQQFALMVFQGIEVNCASRIQIVNIFRRCIVPMFFDSFRCTSVGSEWSYVQCRLA